MNKMIPISELRKRFGEVEKLLPFVDYFIVTKKGKPFATLSATPEVKKTVLSSVAGAFKNTDLDDDAMWEEVLKKRSRKRKVTL